MANIITLNSPSRLDYINRFVDQYTANHRDDEERKNREQQMGLQRQQVEQQGNYQNRMATVQEETYRLAKDNDAYERAKTLHGDAYKQIVEPYKASGRPEDFAVAQGLVSQYITELNDA